MSDTPDFKDDNYTAHIKQLNLVDDIFRGIDSSVKHIQKFNKEVDEEFKARQKEATLDNYVFRTVDTMKNIIFRKSIDKTAINNKELLKWFEKINFKDNLNEFSKKILKNRVKDGYTYILVDSPSYDAEELKSKADLEKNNIRPYFSNITRNQVININYDDFMMIRQISIQEDYKEKVGRFGHEIKPQIRVFEVVGNAVEYSIWREGEEYSNDIIMIPAIPIVKVGDDDVPPLYDQAIININHLNRNSEKSNYVRVGSAPFPLVWGMSDDASVKTLGINSGLVFNGTKAESGFEWAEMSGSNYNMIQEEIKYREEQMERISVEFVTQLKNTTATEVEKASTSNESKLMDYSTELEQGINQAIQMMGMYYPNIKESDVITTNKDFDSNIITTEMFDNLMKLRINNDLSYERLMEILEKGEILSVLDEKEKETEKLRLKDTLV